VQEMPLEWGFAVARSRGVIGYGSMDESAPARIRKVFALEALLTRVTPWPAGVFLGRAELFLSNTQHGTEA
jgi:hypothetical protein